MMDHAAGVSHSPLEWVLVLGAAVVLLCALGLAIRYTLQPKETEATHIKRRILFDETDQPEETPHR